MNFYKRHLGDYAKDAGHLTMLEHGAYTLLLDRYYATERPILSRNEAYRACRARAPAERNAVDAVLDEFFITDGEAFANRRADEEIAKASHQRTVNQELGKRGGRPKRTESLIEQITDSVPIRNPSQTPDSRLQEKEIHKLSLVVAPPVGVTSRTADEKPEKWPACPHLEVLSLWSQKLPALPEHIPSQWKGARADHLRARWRETAVTEGWTDKADGITYFGRLFAYIGRSKFLTGNAPSAQGRSPFIITLAWLVKPENWAKTIEGNYHPEQQA